MKYYIIAGEASGDLHGSNLMRGLYAEDPKTDCRFWGGRLMDAVYQEHQSGIGLVHDYNDGGAVIGFSHVILHLRKHLGKLRRCVEDISVWKPDVVILIDYPGFNFKVAGYAHKHGLKVYYYIAPKVWASRENRIRKLKTFVDRLFIVFPFEKEYFEKRGVPYIYKGNPLVDAIDNSTALKETREEFFSANGIEDSPYIAILAGSRPAEVKCMMPVAMKFADGLHRIESYSAYKFIVAGAPSRTMNDYEPFLKGRDYVRLVFGRTHAVLKHAKAALVNSGTASLEACLIGTPQVVAYSGAAFNFAIGRHIIRVDKISLGNLILGRKSVKELIQYYYTPGNVLSEIRRLIEDIEYRERILADYAEIRKSLGGSGASRSVAKAMIEELQKQ